MINHNANQHVCHYLKSQIQILLRQSLRSYILRTMNGSLVTMGNILQYFFIKSNHSAEIVLVIGLVSLIGPISCISIRSIIYMLVLYFLCIIIELIFLKIWDTIHYILNNLNSYFNANLRILLWHYAYACFSNSCKKKSFRWFTKYSYHFLI